MNEKKESPLSTSTSTSTSNLKLTLKAWPVIAAATIGLCFVTELVAAGFGINLPEQANLNLVRNCLIHAFDNPQYLRASLLLLAQVIVIMPVVEELIFRLLLFKGVAKLTGKLAGGRHCLPAAAVFSSVLFSAAHYITQPWPDAAFLALFFFGMAQCWLYTKTSRLWCAMLNHALFNLTNLLLLFLVPRS